MPKQYNMALMVQSSYCWTKSREQLADLTPSKLHLPDVIGGMVAIFRIRGDVPGENFPFEMDFFPLYKGLIQTGFNLKTDADLRTVISRHS